MWIFVDGGIGFPTLSLPPSPDQSAIYAAMATTAVRSGFWDPTLLQPPCHLAEKICGHLWPMVIYGPFPPSVKGVALLPLICRGSLRPWLDSELINRLEKVLRGQIKKGQASRRARRCKEKDGKGLTLW